MTLRVIEGGLTSTGQKKAGNRDPNSTLKIIIDNNTEVIHIPDKKKFTFDDFIDLRFNEILELRKRGGFLIYYTDGIITFVGPSDSQRVGILIEIDTYRKEITFSESSKYNHEFIQQEGLINGKQVKGISISRDGRVFSY